MKNNITIKPGTIFKIGRTYHFTLTNTRTKEITDTVLGMISVDGKNTLYLSKSHMWTGLKVYITHRNRLHWKLQDTLIYIQEYTSEFQDMELEEEAKNDKFYDLF